MKQVQYARHTGGALFWDSHQWCDYFESNSHPRAVPWDDPPALTLQERMDLGPSIQTFQLGESSDGRRLLDAAEQRLKKQLIRTCQQQFDFLLVKNNVTLHCSADF